ncbi:methyltransferase family protein [Mycolicibacterium arseniciresistens]|uniref:Isoprenylcysteine carboxylmethyltransferase family protein n=1 Tax=Mycolicibacterium arseniciresistens TaxID=3062257 RepID=A0ABT8UFQ7_9MYCO|nr:isoprenylcysteine carboxylmethyltransferase family protein [Mycolicibacterium arseniciresistens]MDO3635218.1 isoprenylcysteine carboxylmethyltransferase family protein [Mycolicibacterium arseniciresistens]
MTDRVATYILRTLLALSAIGLTTAVAAHLVGGRPAPAAFVAAYLVWMLSEARITVGTPTQSAAETRTLVPYAVARVLTVLTAAFSASAVPDEFGIALAGVFVAGVALRAWAIHELGVQYSHRVVPISEGGLTSSGPYSLLRHPAYAGMLLANIGFVVYFSSPASIAALTLLVAAVLWRIRVEEGILTELPQYRAFADTRCRMVPGVW